MTRLRNPTRPLIVALLVAAATGTAFAEDLGVPRAGQLITDPDWARHPVLLTDALRPPRGARVLAVELDCRILASGDLSDCVVLHESPTGIGLADAGLRAARRARVSPATVQQAGPNGRTAFKIAVLSGEPPDLPSPATPRYP